MDGEGGVVVFKCIQNAVANSNNQSRSTIPFFENLITFCAASALSDYYYLRNQGKMNLEMFRGGIVESLNTITIHTPTIRATILFSP